MLLTPEIGVAPNEQVSFSFAHFGVLISPQQVSPLIEFIFSSAYAEAAAEVISAVNTNGPAPDEAIAVELLPTNVGAGALVGDEQTFVLQPGQLKAWNSIADRDVGAVAAVATGLSYISSNQKAPKFDFLHTWFLQN